MKTPKEIESLARRIRVAPSDSADERILRAAQTALDNQPGTVHAREVCVRGRHAMQLRITKWVVAAAVLLSLGIHFLGGTLDGARVTYADVLAEIRDFRPYRCRYSVEEANKPPDVRIMERLSLTRRRESFADGTIVVYDLSIPKELVLFPDRKEAREHWHDFEPKGDFDLLSLANSVQEKAEELGTSVLDGHKVVGFGTAGGDTTLWADVRTRLPVRLEFVHSNAARRIILDQFEFDVPFDEAIFDTTAPEGYAVRKTGKGRTDIPHMGEGLPEEPLLTGLKAVAGFLDGVFPPAIELPRLQQAMRQYVADHGLSEEQKEERLIPVADYWTRAAWYLNQLRGSGVRDLRYMGDGVRFGDSDTAIMWWRPAGSTTYRVIYGDLTVRDLRPEELPGHDVTPEETAR